MASIANKYADVGVVRALDADINVNATDNTYVTDIGVVTLDLNTTNHRDRDGGRPNHKTTTKMDGPTPFNPRTGAIGVYQR